MNDDINHLTLHIQWVIEKPTAPGWSDNRNNISNHTFYWIHDGKGVFKTDKEYEVKGGMLAYMTPGLRMSMRSDADFPLRMTMILFDCAYVEYDQAWNGVTPIQKLQLPFLQAFKPELAKDIGRRFHRIARIWVPGIMGGALQSKTALMELLHTLYSYPAAQRKKSDTTQLAIEKIKERLETEYNNDQTIQELAQQYGISESFLRKRFRILYGTSPKAYQSHIRNEYARRFLMYSDLSIKEIAKLCGYLDEYHFSNAFKKLNQLSPTAYRNSFLLEKS